MGMKKKIDVAKHQNIPDTERKHGIVMTLHDLRQISLIEFTHSLVVTTNLLPKQLEPRIASRLSEGVCVAMNCDNYRLLLYERRFIQIGAGI